MNAPATVPPLVAGRARVVEPFLRARLGRPAYVLLQALWRVRDPKTGETHITNEGLRHVRGFERFPLTAVKRALARLRAASLVEPVGWQRRTVPTATGYAELDVYVRRVLGAPSDVVRPIGAAPVITVPVETRAWLEQAAAWGGPRAGAGRKPADPPPSQAGRLDLIRKGLVSQAFSNQEGPTPFQEGPTPPKSRGAFYRDPLLRSGTSAVSSLRSETAPRGAAPGFDPREGEAPRLEVLAALTDESGAGTAGERLVADGARRERPLVLPATPWEGLPPYPGASVVGLAVVPRPPLLDEGLRSVEKVRALAEAYRGAVTSRTGKRCDTLRFGVLTASKLYPGLVKAAERLVARQIAPAAWAAWSVDQWLANAPAGEERKPPPIALVFSAKRIDEKHGWYAKDESTYMGGRVVLGAAHRDLVRRYLAMRAAIEREGAWGSPGAVVSRYFPEGYGVALEAAQAEARAAAVSLREQAQQGEFLW